MRFLGIKQKSKPSAFAGHKFISVKQFYAHQLNSRHIHFAVVRVSKAIIAGIYLIVYAGDVKLKANKSKEGKKRAK